MEPATVPMPAPVLGRLRLARCNHLSILRYLFPRNRESKYLPAAMRRQNPRRILPADLFPLRRFCHFQSLYMNLAQELSKWPTRAGQWGLRLAGIWAAFAARAQLS